MCPPNPLKASPTEAQHNAVHLKGVSGVLRHMRGRQSFRWQPCVPPLDQVQCFLTYSHRALGRQAQPGSCMDFVCACGVAAMEG
eukprot:2549-Eustigmatos_ZCMA.PRE.1